MLNTKIANAEKSGQWYVATTLPRKERYAIENINRQGFGTFFPRISQSRRVRNRLENVVSPLFPGYVFVRFDLEAQRWQSINGTYGVRGLVSPRGSRPASVPARVMDALLSRCPEGVWERDFKGLSRGDKVSVVAGAFAGFDARFDQLLPQERVRVLLNVLSGEAPVVMPLSCIGMEPA